MQTAILIVDLQNDFLPGGALAVPNGDRVIKPIQKLITRFPTTHVFLSRDWHPPTSKHFQNGGGRWPVHCVQNTHGAQFAGGLDKLPQGYVDVITKGTDPNDDGGYSAFAGVIHDEEFNEHNPPERMMFDNGTEGLIVCGLATDYCVRATVLDAIARGFNVMLYLPGCAAVNVNPEDGDDAISDMRRAGAMVLE